MRKMEHYNRIIVFISKGVWCMISTFENGPFVMFKKIFLSLLMILTFLYFVFLGTWTGSSYKHILRDSGDLKKITPNDALTLQNTKMTTFAASVLENVSRT